MHNIYVCVIHWNKANENTKDSFKNILIYIIQRAVHNNEYANDSIKHIYLTLNWNLDNRKYWL